MRVSQLELAFRVRVDDRTEDFLWPSAWFIDALNEAENEACIRARLLHDDTTPAICRLTTVAGQLVYQLDPRVIDVEVVRLGRCELARVGYEQMLGMQPYNNGIAGMPSGYAISGIPGQGLQLLLDRPVDPSVHPTIPLVVVRLPLQPMRLPNPPTIDDSPEIDATRHRALLHWVVHLAHETRDADASSPQRSAEAAAKFEAEFGMRHSARNEKIRLRHHAVVITGEDRRPWRRSRYRPFVDPT